MEDVWETEAFALSFAGFLPENKESHIIPQAKRII